MAEQINKLPPAPNVDDSVSRPLWDWLIKMGKAINQIVDALKQDTSTTPATPTWTAPTLLNSWTNAGNPYYSTGYYKDDQGMVYIRGAVTTGTIGNTIFTLPAGYRPTKTVPFTIPTDTGYCALNITSDGKVTPVGTSATGVGFYVSFFAEA